MLDKIPALQESVNNFMNDLTIKELEGRVKKPFSELYCLMRQLKTEDFLDSYSSKKNPKKEEIEYKLDKMIQQIEYNEEEDKSWNGSSGVTRTLKDLKQNLMSKHFRLDIIQSILVGIDLEGS